VAIGDPGAAAAISPDALVVPPLEDGAIARALGSRLDPSKPR
jgi:hypothetical protein